MGASERRIEIMKILCRRRHETISNLAFEFDVSERTIRRDIEVLSLSEPIYTQAGRYGGGVYVTDNFTMIRMYMSGQESDLMKKVYHSAENKTVCSLTTDELSIFRRIIDTYTKPTKGNKK